MSIYTLIFYSFALLAALAALALAFSKNVFYSAMYVIVCLLSLAGIYVLSFAEFVAVTQILIYAGGILVVIIFGIMLTAKIGIKPLEVDHGNTLTGLILAIPAFILIVHAFNSFEFEKNQVTPLAKNHDQVQAIGIGLMSEYMLAFEVAGVLMLIALVGAAVIASNKIKEG